MEKYKIALKARTNVELIKDWVALDKLTATPDIATVRGWLMNEIETRWPAEFDAWMENCHIDDNIESYIKL